MCLYFLLKVMSQIERTFRFQKKKGKGLSKSLSRSLGNEERHSMERAGQHFLLVEDISQRMLVY